MANVQIVALSAGSLSEDALNRFRITHSDRDLRMLLRRLHHLDVPIDSNPVELNEDGLNDASFERDLTRLEVLKWKATVERIMGSVENLKRQEAVYRRRAEETAARTEDLRKTLAQEKISLLEKQRERDHLIKCDEVAAIIIARPKDRKELDEQIAELQSSLEDHRASHAIYIQTAQTRIESFAQISKLVEEVRSAKLPIEPQASMVEQIIEEAASDKMEVDDPVSSSSATRLSAQALPFQPTPIVTIPAPASRSSTPPAAALSKAPLKPPTAGHQLPTRPGSAQPAAVLPAPGRSGSTAPVPRSASHSLPSRPSNLRSSTTPAANLEEGEVGGDEEDGEVAEGRGTKRSSDGDGRDGRFPRSRN